MLHESLYAIVIGSSCLSVPTNVFNHGYKVSRIPIDKNNCLLRNGVIIAVGNLIWPCDVIDGWFFFFLVQYQHSWDKNMYSAYAPIIKIP